MKMSKSHQVKVYYSPISQNKSQGAVHKIKQQLVQNMQKMLKIEVVVNKVFENRKNK